MLSSLHDLSAGDAIFAVNMAAYEAGNIAVEKHTDDKRHGHQSIKYEHIALLSVSDGGGFCLRFQIMDRADKFPDFDNLRQDRGAFHGTYRRRRDAGFQEFNPFDVRRDGRKLDIGQFDHLR